MNGDGPAEHARGLLARAHHGGLRQAGDCKEKWSESEGHEARERQNDLQPEPEQERRPAARRRLGGVIGQAIGPS